MKNDFEIDAIVTDGERLGIVEWVENKSLGITKDMGYCGIYLISPKKGSIVSYKRNNWQLVKTLKKDKSKRYSTNKVDLSNIDVKPLKESPFYCIDKDGNIYSIKYSRKKKTKAKTIIITLECGTQKVFSVKNIVANNLIPNPNKYNYILNKDGNVFNNHPSNLEWSELCRSKVVISKDTDIYLKNKINALKGNGNKVCEEWSKNTIEFVKWASKNNYENGKWLKRYDVNKSFSPNNCYFGDPNILKLNCEMVNNIKEMELPNNKIAEKYDISGERVRQIKNGYKLKNCN